MIPKDFKTAAAEDFSLIKGILDSHHIPFFALFGTALGAVRQGDFLAHNNDIDLGITQLVSEEVKDSLLADFTRSGFGAKKGGEPPSGKIEVRRGTLTAIHFLRPHVAPWVCLVKGGGILVSIPQAYLKSLKEYPLGNNKILVPEPANEYLIATYGLGWKTPNKTQHGRVKIG